MTEDGAVIKSTKFSLDPEITSFEMLQSLLAKAFDIKGCVQKMPMTLIAGE